MLKEIEQIDNQRREVSISLNKEKKSLFGQYFTPYKIACFMVSLFSNKTIEKSYLLDPGAGIGILSCAFINQWLNGTFKFKSINVIAYEIDKFLEKELKENLSKFNQINKYIIDGDYIELMLEMPFKSKITHAILNPPYKKINSNSKHRKILRLLGIETVNLYTAFVALTILAMAKKGQIVAIIPRSFCNGPYYRSFREFLLKHTAIKHIHLFKSRSKAFKDDNVLQENIIIHLEKNGKQGEINISNSTDQDFLDINYYKYPFEKIVYPEDKELFIHIPTSPEKLDLEISSNTIYSLADLGISVSTGPVVDFRVKEYLKKMPDRNDIPLFYPTHFDKNDYTVKWPKSETQKPNAIEYNKKTEKQFYENGFYCVVKRFSSKEEKKRIVANTINPTLFTKSPYLAFENHLNVFHINKKELSKELAYGLTVYLNSTVIDNYFRRFNGHTQVNATDLRSLKYPSKDVLVKLGKWAIKTKVLNQSVIDKKIKSILL